MNEPQTIGFDIYGTLVDPLAIASVLQPYAGDEASRFAELWREKQIESVIQTRSRRLPPLFPNRERPTRPCLASLGQPVGRHRREVGGVARCVAQPQRYQNVRPLGHCTGHNRRDAG
jgi:hypothetical protein